MSESGQGESVRQELQVRPPQPAGSGARDLFWATLVPLSLLGALAMASLCFVLSVWLLSTAPALLAWVSALALGAAVVVFLPLQYYLIRSRLERPLTRLEHELLGQLPWQPRGDVLLSSLRRAVDQIRLGALDAREQLERQGSRMEEMQEHLEEQQSASRFMGKVAEALGPEESLEQFGACAATVLREAWPAEHVLLLVKDGSEAEFRIVYHETSGEIGMSGRVEEPGVRYRMPTLPAPVKEALRRGFYVESGLPFSRDPAFPEARSFLALALEHRGAPAGVLLAASSCLEPAGAEGLRRARPLLSLGFSRSMYLREMEEAAITDALTGAYTLDHFLSLLRHEVARANRYSRPASCLLLDIDGLRRVNDSYGARFGDRVIADVVQLVGGLIRSSDILARVSGGELALLLPETSPESAEVVAERLRARVEEHPFLVQGGVVERVTISIGIALHPPHGVTALSLVDAARRGLQQAKSQGRNCVVLMEDLLASG